MPVLLLVLVSLVTSELVYFVEVVRHGARAPSDFVEWDTEERWPYGESYLTPEGMRQHYLIGSFLRERYITTQHFLPEFYNRSSLYLVASTKERAQRSLFSQMLGLYPSRPAVNYSVPITVPLNTNISLDFGSLYLPVWDMHVFQSDPMLHADDNCSIYDDYTKSRKKTDGFQELFEGYQDLVNKVKQKYGLSKKKAQTMLLDIISSIRCNNFSGNSWDPEFDDEFIRRGEELYRKTKLYKSYEPDFVARFTGSVFFNDFLAQLEAVKSGTMDRKASIYSAHDTTLLSLFGTLGLTYQGWPPFASMFLFEVLKEPEGYFIRVMFNMKPIVIPGCQKEECELDVFVNYIRNRAFEDSEKACAKIGTMDVEQEKMAYAEVPILGMSSLNAGVVLVELFVLSVFLYRKLK
jgi:hypothetical protein